MRGFVLFVLWVLCLQVQLVAQEWQWAKGFGDTLGNTVTLTMLEHDGKLLVAGYFDYAQLNIDQISISNSGIVDGFVAEIDSSGECIWMMKVGGNGIDIIKKLAIDNDGNIYVSGEFRSTQLILDTISIFNKGWEDVFLIKIRPDKTIDWVLNLGNSNENYLADLRVDKSNKVYIGINELIWNGTEYNYRTSLTKIDTNAHILWSKSNEPSEIYININGIVDINEDTILIYGQTGNSIQWDDIILTNTNESGNAGYFLKFSKDGTLLTSYTDTIFSAFISATIYNNQVLSLGLIDIIEFGNDNGNYLAIGCYNTVFQAKWAKKVSDCPFDFFYLLPIFYVLPKIYVRSDGMVFIAGNFGWVFCLGADTINVPANYGTAYYSKMFILQMKLDGTNVGFISYGSHISDQITNIFQGANGNVYISGIYNSTVLELGDFKLMNNSPLNSIWLAHNSYMSFKNYYSFIASFNGDLRNNLTNTIHLIKTEQYKYFPNPAIYELNIQGDKQFPEQVPVNILSIDGKMIKSMIISAEDKLLKIDISDLPPGMYIATTIVNQQTSSARFVK
jgi:hypothetical protein